MKIISAEVDNFASYKHLSFKFSDNGLTLISGPTGAGKSTLCDIIPWILFGRTAKNGPVDEIRTWGTDETTIGKVVFEISGERFYIRRFRGSKNDLFFGPDTDYIAEGKRGKDLADTQKLINNLLNLSAETYLAGSYLHEFSQTAQFFTTSAKNRRVITEQLADLSLAKTLQEKLSEYNKELKKERDELVQETVLHKNTLVQLDKTLVSETKKSVEWRKDKAIRIKDLLNKSSNYEQLKQKAVDELHVKSDMFISEQENKIACMMSEIAGAEIDMTPKEYIKASKAKLEGYKASLSNSICKECGASKHIDQVLVLDKESYALERLEAKNKDLSNEVHKLNARLSVVKTQVNPYTSMIEQEKARENTYKSQLDAVRKDTDPYETSIESLTVEIGSLKALIKVSETLIKDFTVEQSDLSLLLDTLDTFRGVIISQNVEYIEKYANSLLNEHFDAEIRVGFNTADSDKLEVSITKDGNQCSFTQLSKGQRQLLKLCFGVSVMSSVSNHNGVDFNCLFFDEALDGMDENIKAKSFNLLEKLSLKYENIYVVEHSESFKSLFNNKIEVELVDGRSQLEKF